MNILAASRNHHESTNPTTHQHNSKMKDWKMKYLINELIEIEENIFKKYIHEEWKNIIQFNYYYMN